MPIIYSKVTTEPESEPITLDEAKIHLRVSHDDEDELITILIQAAREIIEQSLNRSLITQTRTIKLDYFPRCNHIVLPYGPISSQADNIEVTYIDENEDSQTLSADDYWVDSSSNIPKIVVKNSWPSTFTMPNAVTVEYVAGYGEAVAVPKAIKQAIYLRLGHLYENRESVLTDQSYVLTIGEEALLSQYVVEHSVVY